MNAVPAVLDRLDSDAWRRRPEGPSSRYLGVLLSLLHELDPDAYRLEIERLRSEPLHALHKLTVQLISKRFGDQIFGKIGGDVPVYISRDVDQPDVVFSRLQRWSKTRDLAISKVTRVDVIVRQDEIDYLGLYSMYYDCIVLTWPNNASSFFDRLLRNIRAEQTFYHEVGHHFHQHSEGGQVQEQEREAENYSWRMYRNAHPILVSVARVIFAPVLWAMRLKKRFAKMRNEVEM